MQRECMCLNYDSMMCTWRISQDVGTLGTYICNVESDRVSLRASAEI